MVQLLKVFGAQNKVVVRTIFSLAVADVEISGATLQGVNRRSQDNLRVVRAIRLEIAELLEYKIASS